MSVRGAKAVQIPSGSPGSNLKLEYCNATSRTLAISHVWTHGQGGRPEKGVNRCLHERYCRIGADLGCDSYWIDAACIPSTHELRSEAISHINGIFGSCRAVLVCDRDIMKIDIRNFSIDVKESLLVAAILSDWNARASTLLESMKGRQNIFLLCKDNMTTSFPQALMEIIQGGRIDIAVFIWHVYHMLPSKEPLRSWKPKIHQGDDTPALPLSSIGSLLSYRPASRDGDDFTIWSLLIDPEKDPKGLSNAAAFWKAQVGRYVTTGYLMCSAGRLKTKGLSWAPESPYVTAKKPSRQLMAASYQAFDGSETSLGEITEEGLWAKWRKYDVDPQIWPHRKAKSAADKDVTIC